MSGIACSNMVPSAPRTVFRGQSFASLSRCGCGIPGSPTGLEDLTPDKVPLWVAGRQAYRTLDDRKGGGVWALPRIMRPRCTGVRLTRGSSCDREVLEICTTDR